jgi:hypothetical protein
MKNMTNNFAEIFDIEPVEEETPQQEVLPAIVEDKSTSDTEIDFEFARQNMKTLIGQGNLAVEHIISVAKATDHPRAFEVVATLMNTVAGMNKDLMAIRKVKQDVIGEKKASQINVDKAVFVGSTADLIRQIKENK